MAIRRSEKLKRIIQNKRKVEFTYTNLKGETKRRKNVEMHTQGYTKKGKSAVRAYEPGKGWRLFLSSSIRDFKRTNKTFKKTRPGYNPNDRGLRSVSIKTKR